MKSKITVIAWRPDLRSTLGSTMVFERSCLARGQQSRQRMLAGSILENSRVSLDSLIVLSGWRLAQVWS
jgi:hypothetical protein